MRPQQKSFKRRALEYTARILANIPKILGSNFGPKFKAQLSQEFVPIKTQQTSHGPIRFFCPGELTLMRADTLLSKEPETIGWIDSFETDTVFWDIGANVGVYTLYAAKAGCSRILAFEPSAFNYHILTRNLELNGFDRQVSAYSVAFDSHTSAGTLKLSTTDAGAALHNYVTQEQNPDSSTEFFQGMFAFSLDEYVRLFQPDFPNHLKIDVDGLEPQILEGGKAFLKDTRLKSILIEFDPDNTKISESIYNSLNEANFKLHSKHPPPQSPGATQRTEMNHIFKR